MSCESVNYLSENMSSFKYFSRKKEAADMAKQKTKTEDNNKNRIFPFLVICKTNCILFTNLRRHGVINGNLRVFIYIAFKVGRGCHIHFKINLLFSLMDPKEFL